MGFCRRTRALTSAAGCADRPEFVGRAAGLWRRRCAQTVDRIARMVIPDDAAHRVAEAAGWTRMPELELDPELVALFRSGATEQALLELRRAGFHILDGIRALKKYAG